jgi:hypothetical protein
MIEETRGLCILDFLMDAIQILAPLFSPGFVL